MGLDRLLLVRAASLPLLADGPARAPPEGFKLAPNAGHVGLAIPPRRALDVLQSADMGLSYLLLPRECWARGGGLESVDHRSDDLGVEE